MLTESQEIKMEEVLSLILTENKKRIVLKGSAGVGKTYLVQEILNVLKARGFRGSYYVTAPTHKALSVLRTKVQQKTHIIFKTIHSALGLTRKINEKTGEEFYTPSKFKGFVPFDGGTLCVIDEASMLSTELLTFLENFPRIVMLFIGDEKQLPPVNEAVSPIFTQGYPEVELTEIIRQGAGNPIIDLSRDIKLVNGNAPSLVTTESGQYIGYLHTKDREKIYQTLAHYNGTDDVKYLAWTNIEIEAVNRKVRQIIYGAKPSKVELGETLVFSKPYGEHYTNEEVRVVSLAVVPFNLVFPTARTIIKNGELQSGPGSYDIEPITVYRVNSDILVLHEESKRKYNELCRELKNLCIRQTSPWVNYFWFIEQLAQITYNHAITVHKSQGSTYKKAIISVTNINQNRKFEEKCKLFYTAVTRASELVILYHNH